RVLQLSYMPEVSKKPSQKIEPQARDFQIFRALFESRLMTLNHIKDLYFRGSYRPPRKGLSGLRPRATSGIAVCTEAVTGKSTSPHSCISPNAHSMSSYGAGTC